MIIGFQFYLKRANGQVSVIGKNLVFYIPPWIGPVERNWKRLHKHSVVYTSIIKTNPVDPFSFQFNPGENWVKAWIACQGSILPKS